MPKSQKKQRPKITALTVLGNSPVKPLERSLVHFQLLDMYLGLRAMETSPEPQIVDWLAVTRCIDIVDALRKLNYVADRDGLIQDAEAAMGVAAARSQDKNKPIRIPGWGLEAVRGVLADYAMCLNKLPARAIVEAVRKAMHQ